MNQTDDPSLLEIVRMRAQALRGQMDGPLMPRIVDWIGRQNANIDARDAQFRPQPQPQVAQAQPQAAPQAMQPPPQPQPPQPMQQPQQPAQPRARPVGEATNRSTSLGTTVSAPNVPQGQQTSAAEQLVPQPKVKGSRDLYAEADALLEQQPDYAQLQAQQRQRAASGRDALVMALIAQGAGRGFDPFTQHYLRQSSEMQAPMRIEGGQLVDGEAMLDPGFQRQRKVEIAQRRADRAREQETAETLARDKLAEARAQAQREEALRLSIAQLRPTPSPTMVQTVDENGNPVFIDARNAAGMPAFVKPGAGVQDTKRSVSDSRSALQDIEDAKGLLPNATGSGAGSLVDKGAAFFGSTTEGAQAAAGLKVIAGRLTGYVPKFSGPQSDKDVQLYKEMAGQVGDDTLPMQTRLAALREVQRMHQRNIQTHGSGGGSQPQAAGGGVMKFNPATGRLE